jgi:hypothetical protein
VHLLEWAGLATRPDTDTLLWALRHAGGTKTAIIHQLLRTNFGNGMMLTDKDIRRVYKEVHTMRDEAQKDNDIQKLAFVEDLLSSEVYNALVERM